MRQVLKFLGLITGIGSLVTALRTPWEAFDAYGTVLAGESASLRLPRGTISISFETSNRTSRGVPSDVPSIVGPSGQPVTVEFMVRSKGRARSRPATSPTSAPASGSPPPACPRRAITSSRQPAAQS
jgi:hypothetical protein